VLTVITAATAEEKRIVKAERVEVELSIGRCEAIKAIDAATAIIERYIGYTLAPETVQERIAGRNTNVLRLERHPITEIVEFSENDYVENTDYYVDYGKGWLIKASGVWAEEMHLLQLVEPELMPKAYATPNYTVTYKSGYSVMPADLQDAALNLCRTLVSGVDRQYQSQTIGDWSYSLGAGGVVSGILEQLNHYRVIA